MAISSKKNKIKQPVDSTGLVQALHGYQGRYAHHQQHTQQWRHPSNQQRQLKLADMVWNRLENDGAVPDTLSPKQSFKLVQLIHQIVDAFEQHVQQQQQTEQQQQQQNEHEQHIELKETDKKTEDEELGEHLTKLFTEILPLEELEPEQEPEEEEEKEKEEKKKSDDTARQSKSKSEKGQLDLSGDANNNTGTAGGEPAPTADEVSDAFEVLGFSSDGLKEDGDPASKRDVDQAFRRQALKTHPDKYKPSGPDLSEEEQQEEKQQWGEKFKELSNAHDKLSKFFDQQGLSSSAQSSASAGSSGGAAGAGAGVDPSTLALLL